MAGAAAQARAQIRNMLEVCGFSNGHAVDDNVAERFQRLHKLNDTRALKRLKAEDAKSLVSAYNKRHDDDNLFIGGPLTRSFEALIYWVHERKRQQLGIDPAAWDEDTLDKTLQDMDIQEREKDNEATKDLTLEKIQLSTGWYEWELGFVNFLASKWGVQGRLNYVVRRDKPPGWDPDIDAIDEEEARSYRLRLQGGEYNADNLAVWQHIQQATLGTEAYPHIKEYEKSRDGRNAMIALRQVYEGEGEMSKRKEDAKATLSHNGEYYADERRYPFLTYATQLKRAYQTMDECGIPYADSQKVDRLYEGMRFTTGDVRQAMNNMRDQHGDNFEAAVNYMSRRISQIFPNAARDRSSKRRRISQASTTGRGRGGRGGRGGRRNFGRGGQRGGRGGGRGAGNHRHRVMYGDVDLTDPHRRLSQQEMDSLGPQGQRFLFDLRRRERSGGQRGDNNSAQGAQQGDNNGRTISGTSRNDDSSVVTDVSGVTNPPASQPGSTSQGGAGRTQSTGGRSGSGFGRGAYAPP